MMRAVVATADGAERIERKEQTHKFVKHQLHFPFRIYNLCTTMLSNTKLMILDDVDHNSNNSDR